MDIREGNVIAVLKARKKPQPFRPFPAQALPKPVSTFIEEAAETLGCDMSFIALPLLSGLASAIGNSRRIRIKQNWTEPAILWTGIVGDSGTMKSPAIDMALRPLRRKQNEAFKDYAKKMEEYRLDAAEYERAVRNRKQGDELGEKPIEPVATRYYCSDITIEALAGLLSNAPRGLLLARDELSGWIKSFDAYKNGRGGDDSKWLELHRAGTLLVDRKSGTPKTIHISDASVGICGGIQPGILQRVLGTENFENGLAARLLLAMPPRKAKRWTDADVDEGLRYQIQAVFDGLLSMEMENDGFGSLEPVDIELTDEGRQLWVEFYNFHAAQQAEINDPKLAAVWSKLEGYTARIALVIHCVRVAAGDESLKSDSHVDEASIEAAATISQWFGHEIRRIYGVLEEDEEEQDQRRLLELVEKKGGRITPRELMRSTSRFQGSAEVAESALQELVDINWGHWGNVQAGAGGGRPSKVFLLNNEKA